MALTVLVQSGYVPWNTRKVYILPAVASMAAPTRTEINAGHDITPQLTDMAGWTKTPNTTDSQSFVGPALKLAIAPTLDQPTLTQRLSKEVADIRSIVTDGGEYFALILNEGDDDSQVMDVFHVNCNGFTPSEGSQDPATTVVSFGHLSQPVFGAPVPT